ncbi:hypothetical protein BH11PLA2_BH11PLA2_06140 [soil metagenome]
MRRSAILACSLTVTLLALAQAQPGGLSDTVKYRTKDGAEKTSFGELKETPAGIVITSNGKTVATIAPHDVIAVYYGKMAGVDGQVRQELPQWDAKGGLEARNKYADLLKTASGAGADERTKRFLEFRVAVLSAKVADTKTGEEFKTEAAAAIDKLTTVARSYTKSWEAYPAARHAARLQAEIGKYSDAATTLATVAKIDGLPPELKGEAKLGEVDALFRSGSALSAAPAIEELGKSAATLTNAQKDRLNVFQAALKGAQDKTEPAKVNAAAVAVRTLVDKMTDPVARAGAHNTLGELFFMANMTRDAMWEYLWVEAVYNQDKEEVIKALDRLATIFEKLGEKDRAAVYREKLLKAKAG